MRGIFEWIDTDGRFRLALMPRPPGGKRLDAAMAVLREEGVDVMVSLQTEAEAAECELADEGPAAQRAGMVFRRFAIDDHGVPSDTEAAIAFADSLVEHLEGGQSVLLHCYAGIGRSGLMALLVLMRAGYELDDAAYRTRQARQMTVPETRSQWAWLESVQGPAPAP